MSAGQSFLLVIRWEVFSLFNIAADSNPMVHSRLQLSVLSLYKELLRASAKKPGVETIIKSEFRRQARLGRSDTLRIEYQMRIGRRKLEMIRDPHVSGIGQFVDK